MAEVPLAEVTTYARSLSSITGGQGSYTIEFSHYDVVPGQRAAGDHLQGADEGRGRGVGRRKGSRPNRLCADRLQASGRRAFCLFSRHRGRVQPPRHPTIAGYPLFPQ